MNKRITAVENDLKWIIRIMGIGVPVIVGQLSYVMYHLS